MENLSGRTIKGYELRERLGAGGFGAVYKAYQSTVGREVAIKIILPHFANHPDFIRRFETEAQLVARLEHPYITPLYDYWRDTDGAYLVMRWLKGGSLRDALQQRPFELPATVLLMDQIAAALTAAHRNQVIHRDLKPANILLDEDGNAYLGDFGIAKDMGIAKGVTEVDAIVGSPDYLAPEQARSEPVTPQTDLYSLGVVLYEILTGQHPFPQLSAVERLYKHLNDPLPDITTLPAAITFAINEVIQKATAKNPIHRYADALEMTAAFRSAVTHQSVTSNALVEQLTRREQDILQRIVDGLSNKEIAQELFLTLATVKWYVNQIYNKLGVRSRVQAMVRARDLNLIVSGSADTPAVIPTEDFKPDNPYKGLRAFQAADHADFFGREKLVQKLVRRLGEGKTPLRFLAVVGPSGSGKSSLVKAGLIPALWRGDVPGSEKWFVVEMLPGAHPLEELELALTRIAANQVPNLNEHLRRDERGLLRAASLILPNDGSDLVLVIDQFEEVFTMVEDEAARVHFLGLLHTAATDGRSRVRVIVTLRADYYDRPLHYPQFGDLLREHMETVLPLSAEELERAIAKPAERVGARFEDGLVASIVGEVNYQPAALPLLQYALTELFEQRKGRLLTREAYDGLGRAVGALAQRADELYLALDEAGKEIAHQMFLRLVTLGEGAEDTRRRAARSELLSATSEPEVAEEILDTYAAYRLLTLDNDPGTCAPTVELAHEALIREWDRLKGWLNESRAEIRLQRQLSGAAQEWHEAQEDASFLLRGSRLEVFEGWARETTLALTPREKRYLAASLAAREREQAAETARQAREAQQQAATRHMEQRSIFFLRALVTVLTFALIGAGGLTGFALDRQQQAQIERDRARELALVNGAQAALYGENGDLALALAVAANLSDNPSGQAQMILGDAAYSPGTVYLLDGTTAPLTSAQFTPDGSTIVTTARDGQITRWDVATGTPLQAFQSSDGIGWWNNVLSPDGDTLAVLAADGSLELWNVGTEERYQHIRDDEAQASAVAFSSDVGTVVIGYTDGRLVLWNITTNTPDRTFAGHTTMVNSIAFNPANPDLFLSADNDGSVILWQTDSDHPLHVASAESSGHFSTAWADFAPDGNSIISVSRDNMMIVRRTETFEQIRRFALNAPLISLDVSPDGQSVLCGTGDGSVIVDLATGQLRLRLSGYASEVPAVSYSPDGSMALTLSQEGTARLWDVGYGAELWQQTLPSDGFSIALSPDRQRLAVGTLLSNPPDPARLILYDTNTGEELQRLATPDDYPFVVGDLAFSPDGTLLISIGDGSTILWDAMTGTELMRLETAGDVSFDNLFALFQYSVAFSLDGTIALTHDPSNGLALWNVQRESTSFGERILMITDTGSPATRSLFMPDGQSLLTGHTDGTLRLWDANTGTFLRSMGTPAPDNSRVIINLTIIQDGSVVYSAGADGIIRSWQVETGQVIHEFTGHVGQVNALVLSPDQQTLFSAGIDGTIIHWDTISAQPIRRYSSVIAPINALASDGQTLFSAEFGLTLRRWRVDTLPQLLNWTFEHRYVRELTCTERALYSVVPGCDLQGIYPTRTPFSLP